MTENIEITELRKFSCFSQVLRIDWHMFEPRLHLVLKLQPLQALILVMDMCLKNIKSIKQVNVLLLPEWFKGELW